VKAQSLLIISLLILAACQKDRQQNFTNPEKEKYDIVDLTFSASPSDTEQLITMPRPNLEYSNGTSLQQRVEVKPEGIFESSTFQSTTYDIVASEHAIPQTITGTDISLSAKKWLYKEEETRQPSALVFQDVIFVDPNKKLTVNLSIVYRKITARYVLKLKGQSSGEQVSVNGTWTGIYPVKDVVTYKTTNL
jgi:hypothetical protein